MINLTRKKIKISSFANHIIISTQSIEIHTQSIQSAK